MVARSRVMHAVCLVVRRVIVAGRILMKIFKWDKNEGGELAFVGRKGSTGDSAYVDYSSPSPPHLSSPALFLETFFLFLSPRRFFLNSSSSIRLNLSTYRSFTSRRFDRALTVGTNVFFLIYNADSHTLPARDENRFQERFYITNKNSIIKFILF